MRYPLFGIRRKESLGHLKHYLVGVALVAGAVLLRLVIASESAASAPFITFFPATALAALIGGLGPGVMVATGGALIASVALFPRPITAFLLEDWVLLGFYLLTEIIICLVIDAMHAANSRYLALVEETEPKQDDNTFVPEFHRPGRPGIKAPGSGGGEEVLSLGGEWETDTEHSPTWHR